jgi:suppressor for copper-sensitivity B
VIYIVSFTDKRYTIPALIMLLGVSLALWMIGNLYDINSRIRHKWTVRTAAFLLAGVICWIGFSLAGESKHRLAWEPFSEARMTALMKEHKTILVDFTADWCANCQLNEFWALNTQATQDLVEENGVVPLLADFTNTTPEIQRWLAKFQQVGVPLTVIVPGGRPEPIVLRGVYTQGKLLAALKEALGPSPSAQAQDNSIITR